jgi:hypothetical protein
MNCGLLDSVIGKAIVCRRVVVSQFIFEQKFVKSAKDD